jgi:uncharacterized membrane protein (DUF373 family)
MDGDESSDPFDPDRTLGRLVDGSELVMESFELLTGMVLVGLFAIGLFDLVVRIAEAIAAGEVAEVENVVAFIDTVLLLLIIVEVFRTVVAFAREESVVRIIINAGLVAVARKVINFRPDTYPTQIDALVAAGTIAVLLVVLVGAYYFVRRAEAIDPLLVGKRDST